MTLKFNPVVCRILLKYLNPKKGEKILDLGCGEGCYMKEIEQYTKDVIGIDNSRGVVEKVSNPKILCADGTSLPFDSLTFDKIYSLNTIEHIADLEKLFSEVSRVLKPGGIAVFLYPFEPIRGVQATVAACRQYNNPFAGRKIHLHSLNPNKIKTLILHTELDHKQSMLFFFTLSYITVLQKPVYIAGSGE